MNQERQSKVLGISDADDMNTMTYSIPIITHL